MHKKIIELYQNNKNLVVDLLFLSPNISYRDLTIMINKYRNNDETVIGDILALCREEEREFIYNVITPIPNKETFLQLVLGIRRVGEGITVEDYIKDEYKKIRNNNSNALSNILSVAGIMELYKQSKDKKIQGR